MSLSLTNLLKFRKSVRMQIVYFIVCTVFVLGITPSPLMAASPDDGERESVGTSTRGDSERVGAAATNSSPPQPLSTTPPSSCKSVFAKFQFGLSALLVGSLLVPPVIGLPVKWYRKENATRGLPQAVMSNDVELVRQHLANGADVHAVSEYVLMEAAAKGHAEVVKLLLEKGADVHADNDLWGKYALTVAVARGHVEVVKLLVEKGADVHAYNDLALRWAADAGHVEVVKLLVEKGADVHAVDEYALTRAVDRGHVEVVKILLENGASIEAASKGNDELRDRLKKIQSELKK